MEERWKREGRGNEEGWMRKGGCEKIKEDRKSEKCGKTIE